MANTGHQDLINQQQADECLPNCKTCEEYYPTMYRQTSKVLFRFFAMIDGILYYVDQTTVPSTRST